MYVSCSTGEILSAVSPRFRPSSFFAYDLTYGTLPTGYRRTGLVIWPIAHDEVIESGEGLSEWAIEQIEQTETGHPTRMERRLVEYLFDCVDQGDLLKSTVTSTICTAAVLWHELDLWERAVEISGGDYSTGLISAPDALDAFGFDNVREM